MNPSAEPTHFDVRKPEDYHTIHERLSTGLNKRRFFNDDLEAELPGAKNSAAALHYDSSLDGADIEKHEEAIRGVEGKMLNRLAVTQQVSAKISPFVKSLRRVGIEVRSRENEIKDDYSIEIANHQITQAKHALLLRELDQAERFIENKNAIIKDLQQQISDLKSSGSVGAETLEITKTKLAENVERTKKDVNKLQAAIDNIKAIKFETRSFPEATKTPEVKRVILTPEKAGAIVKSTLSIVSVFMKNGAPHFVDKAKKIVATTKKALENMDDSAEKTTILAELDAALVKVEAEPVASTPAPTPATPAAVTPVASTPATPNTTVKKESSPMKKTGLATLAVAAALGASPLNETPKNIESTPTIASAQIFSPRNGAQEAMKEIEKVGNVVIDTKNNIITVGASLPIKMKYITPQTIVVDGNKYKYFLATYNDGSVGGRDRNYLIPTETDMATYKEMSKLGDNYGGATMSHVAYQYLKAYPQYAGVGVFSGMTTLGTERSPSGQIWSVPQVYNFKANPGRTEISSAQENKFEIKTNEAAKKIFSTDEKYKRYEKELAGKSLSEFRKMSSYEMVGLEKEFAELGEIFKPYLNNTDYLTKSISELLNGIPR